MRIFTPGVCRPAAMFLIAVAAVMHLGQGEAEAQGWPNYARDPQHTCLGSNPSKPPERIRWSTPVDLQPQYSNNGNLLIHYGSPLITRVNTVILPVKVGTGDGFKVEARRATDGALLWTQATDYSLPPYSWVPICGISLTPKDKYVVVPGAGGTVLQRSFPDASSGTTSRLAFYGLVNYNANPAAFNTAIKICTPISVDKLGNLYFGYLSTGAALPGYPNGIPSGLARISTTGVGSFVSAKVISNDNAMNKVMYNCAPAFTEDGATLYVAVNNSNFGRGYLCAVDTKTLARKSSVALLDPRSTPGNVRTATLSDDSSATPTVGPDGDVYFGVLESSLGSNLARGWLLRFSADLATTKAPSAFGWDDTPSIVPAAAVPSYTGSSTYLLLTKYNFYAQTGGRGRNQLGIFDPNTTVVDNTTGTPVNVMKPVITILAPTFDPKAGIADARTEWCINSAAIDPVNKCAVVNNEDGRVYRWDFTTNTLTAGLTLAPPTGEAYTSTLIGPDGAVYAINNARLFCCTSN